jgi:hypothetical protein
MSSYLVVTDELVIRKIRDNPVAYSCYGCELQLFNVVLVSPRELLDHVELHRTAGHAIPASAIEAVQKELE